MSIKVNFAARADENKMTSTSEDTVVYENMEEETESLPGFSSNMNSEFSFFSFGDSEIQNNKFGVFLGMK
jgi:hypothetical protein